MNLYLGVMQGGVTIGNCTDAEEIRGSLQFLPNPHATAYSVNPMQGPPRGAFVPAGARAAGAIVVNNCAAPNPGFPTAPLSISLMVGKTPIVPDDDDLSAFGRRPDPSAAIAIVAGCREVPPVRDPYEILGVKRGASLEEIKAAYRRACKQRHPDLGGSHEAMVELNTAYAFVLNELKTGYQRQQRRRQERRRARVHGRMCRRADA